VGLERIALVGIGHIATTVAVPALAALDGLEVVALADAVARRRRQASRLLPGARRCATLEEAVAATRPDGVYIAAPTPLHDDLLREAVASGLPVLCEKPLSAQSEFYGQIRLDAELGGRPLPSVVHNRVFEPGLRKLREIVQAGRIGEPRVVRWTQSMREPFTGWWDENPDWRLEAELPGSGVLADLAYHGVYSTSYLLDRAPTAMHWSAGAPVTGEPQTDGAGTVVLDYGEVTTELTVAWEADNDRFRIEITGTDGKASFDYPDRVELIAPAVRERVICEDAGIVPSYRRMFDAWRHGSPEAAALSFAEAERTWLTIAAAEAVLDEARR
jgi:predicted dehydrogenase